MRINLAGDVMCLSQVGFMQVVPIISCNLGQFRAQGSNIFRSTAYPVVMAHSDTSSSDESEDDPASSNLHLPFANALMEVKHLREASQQPNIL